MADLGDIFYTVIIKPDKAKAGLQSIEAEADAMIARINAKMSGIGFGGKGGGMGGGGYSGGSSGVAHPSGGVTSGGQPSGGSGAATAAATAATGGAVAGGLIARAVQENTEWAWGANSPSQHTTGGGLAAAVQSMGAFGSGQGMLGGGNQRMLGGYPTVSVAGHRVIDNPARMLPGSEFAPYGGSGGGAGGTSGRYAGGSDFDLPKVTAKIASRLIAIGLDVAVSALNADANFAKNMQNAGTNGFAQSRAYLQRRRDAFGAIPLIGGSLGNIATYQDEMYTDNLEAQSNLTGTLNRAGFAGGISGRNAQATRLSALPYTQKNLRAGISFSSRTAEIQDKISAVKASADYQKQAYADNGDYEAQISQIKERDPKAFARLKSKFLAGGSEEDFRRDVNQFAVNQNAALNGRVNTQFARQTAASAAQDKADLAQIEDDRQKELGYGNASLAGKRLANNFRPVAGSAATQIGEFQTDLDIYKKQHAQFAASHWLTSDPDKEPFLNKQRMRVANLEGERADVLRNLYSGTPQEINGFQSIEALQRPRGLESDQMKLESLQEAIDNLTKAINDQDSKKGGTH